MHDFPENRLCRILSHPLALGGGILLLGLSLLQTPNLFFCAAPGFALCFCWLLLTLHKKPDGIWQPRKLSLRALAECKSVIVTPELIFTGGMRIGRVASPIALSKTLSIRSQSSSFLLATAAALTCPRITNPADAAAIHHSLMALGVDPEKMQRQWRLISFDAPEGLTGVTVQDGSGTRCFCMGDPLMMILTCGHILTGAARAMTTDDRTELLRTLESVKQAGGSAIAYAMLDTPGQTVGNAVFLGMLSLEPEVHPLAWQELSALAGEMDVFADVPEGLLPEALRHAVHPTAQCPDVPVYITTRPRRGACLIPEQPAADRWSVAMLGWKHWSCELLRRTRFSLMTLMPALIWLLFAAIHPGQHSMTAALAPSLVLLLMQRFLATSQLSGRWLIIWPAITLVLALFAGIPFRAASVGSLFLPGMYVCALSGQIMFFLPAYMAFSAEQRRRTLIILAACITAAAILLFILQPTAAALPFALALGGAWGISMLAFLCRRLEQRM